MTTPDAIAEARPVPTALVDRIGLVLYVTLLPALLIAVGWYIAHGGAW